MSEKELRRAGVLARVKAGELKLKSAAEILAIGYRQAKRLWKRYRRRGAKGLAHGNANRRSNRAKAVELRAKVLRLVREKYSGEAEERFGPRLAAEHLESDHGLKVSGETLRLWMLEEGLWSRARRRKQHRQRRERRKHFGELVQLDGSPHAWLEDRAANCCLVDMVDDATGVSFGLFSDEETTWSAADVLRGWIELYGVPRALYVDRHSAYVHTPSEAEKLRGEAAETQFGRMCRKLGIRIITAHSPQAKGRIERGHGTHQDRLIKKLRLKGISKQEEANRYLSERYWVEHNRRFARAVAEPEDYHVKAPSKRELDAIFRLEQERVISNDWVVRYGNRWLQIRRESRYAPAGSRVTVSVGRQGDVKLFYRGRPVAWEDIPAPLPRRLAAAVKAEPIEIHRKPVPPPAVHPWKTYAYQTMKEVPVWAAR